MSDYFKRMMEEQERQARIARMDEGISSRLQQIAQREAEAIKALDRLNGGIWAQDRQTIETINGASRGLSFFEQRNDYLRGLGFLPGSRELDPSFFRSPTMNEIIIEAQSRLTSSLSGSAASMLFTQDSPILKQIEAMQQPWMHTLHPERSISGILELQAIGLGVHSANPYENDVSALLRGSLGDWRSAIFPEANRFSETAYRTEFYISQGFNRDLVDFPLPALRESMAIAGFVIPEVEEEQDGDDIEVEFARNNAAHDKLQRFEYELRRFIESVMELHYGPKWHKQNVPGVIWQKWRQKKADQLALGSQERAWIDYADFTDYWAIMEPNNVWNDVFSKFFARKEDIKESLHRLYPIRNPTMHTVFITPVDVLYLLCETTRILMVIRKYKSP